MTTDRCKLLRQMTGDYLARPDPVAWLAAADIHEEAGDQKKAALWRRRGELFPFLLAKYEAFWRKAKEAGWVRMRNERFLLGGVAAMISQNATRSSFVAEAVCGRHSVGVFIRRAYEPQTRYVTAKLMKVVDWVGRQDGLCQACGGSGYVDNGDTQPHPCGRCVSAGD